MAPIRFVAPGIRCRTAGRGRAVACAGVVVAAFCATAVAQLRVAQWNVTNYTSTLPSPRDEAFKAALYGEFEGRRFAPDVLVAQEMLSAASVTAFKGLLNGAAGSPGDWEAAAFIDGPDTDSALFYRKSRVDLLSVAVISIGGPSPAPPRHTMRYLVRLKDYTSDGAVLAIYSSHMKAGTTADDQARRLVEAQRIRDNAESLPPAYHFLLAADLNMRSSDEAAYVELVGSQPNDDGRFFDAIKTPGTWYSNFDMRFVHTQDPAGAGGMDDRFDQLLLEDDLIDGEGFDYVGSPQVAYSKTTWNDPLHSYRAWGNDGTSFNQSLTIAGNAMVGAAIAQALVTCANNQGHLPVFLDLRVPPKIDSATLLDFGKVREGAPANQALTVANAGDETLWTAAGVADLKYSMAATPGFTVPFGPFVESAGGGGNEHAVSMDTSTLGPRSGVLTISSNAPDEPARLVVLVGEVVGGEPCPDLDGDGDVDQSDLGILLADFGCTGGTPVPPDPGDCPGDLDGDGDVDQSDLGILLAGFGASCR